MRRSLFAVLCVLRVLCGPSVAGAVDLPPEMDRLLMTGTQDIYRMRFDEAEAAARAAIQVDPAHPYPYFGLAAVYWTRFVYETDRTDTTLLPPFEENVNKVIALSHAWLKQHPEDPQVLMVLGAAYGISARLNVVRRNWIRAYLDGRKALSFTRQAVKADPKFWDAYLGLGMYDYYADLYPRYVALLTKLVLGGDRQRGIRTLRTVAEKGHFSRDTATVLLVEIYTEDPYGAKDPAKAVALMDLMRARYPDSRGMHSARVVALYEAARYQEAAKVAAEYIDLVKKGVYPPVELAKGEVLLATAQWALGQKDKALDSFREASKVVYRDRLGRWAVWALVRVGNLEDSLGRRQDALRDYGAAAAEPDLWDIRRYAKAGLSKPFSAQLPGPIPPP